MYQLNKFCNIIYKLRKDRGWTQAIFAEKLGISTQAISKWECGIGYPDITLFPVIAEMFDVPIGVLFGETNKENEMEINLNYERKFVFEPLHRVELRVGNECEITVIKNEDEKAYLEVNGDRSFMEFIGLEKDNGVLRINVKNPTGSDTKWIPYDRGNYTKRNVITLHTGKAECQLLAVNYLDLNLYASEIDDNTDKWVYIKESL